ncbi:MAG: ribosome biogenesis GTPase Der [Candidatus Aminicenantes bacterium]|nr:ribosome biogenesis GTPase Der [Candidatus Aminicenantes bacterium]
MIKLPKVVILGFPNVGKSTLFNQLLRKRIALVHNLPGMTRDCVSALWSLQGKKLFLIDTGGFSDTEREPLAEKIKEKAWQAALQANLLILVLDGRRDLLPAEEDLYQNLKKLGKPLFIVVNKIDTAEMETKVGHYFRLYGDEIFLVSAEHRRNLELLEEAISARLPAVPQEEISEPLRLAIIGRVNVGKSSLINRLCGEERLIVSEIPGTTRDLVESFVIRSGRFFSLIDTAGLRQISRVKDEREKASVIVTRKRIRQADVLCLVMDIMEFPTRQDMAIASLASESGKPLIIALNKWDLIPNEKRDEVARLSKEAITQRMDFVSYAPVIFVSAKTGKGVVNLLDEALKVDQQARRQIDTHSLNEFLEKLKLSHPPLWQSRGGVRIKYITQIGIKPPTFILFVNKRDKLLPAYEKFFLSQLRKEFNLWGTPLRLKVREG